MRVPLLTSRRSRELGELAHSLIPGGAHTYAKGDDQYPALAPALIERGEGCRVWDIDGNEFIEYGMGLRAVTLGHAYPPVVEAAAKQMRLGQNFTRPALIEVQCAELIVDLFSAADMVKFCKDGSTATTAAVRLARAYTGRDFVAICADHPFFSYDDWFIGTTPMNAGIPRAVQDLSVTFRYNDLNSVEELFATHPEQIACVILEAERADEPQNDFLQQLQDLCARNGSLFILDEMITGFRLHLGGAQEYYGLRPDLSTFGKGMANGFPVSALVGKRRIMELGGLSHSSERVFLLSTTHGAESIALAATIATIEVYRQESVIDVLHRQGERLRAGIEAAARGLGLERHFVLVGSAPNLAYVTRDQQGAPSQAFRTLFLQETLRRGFILPSLVVSFCHDDDVVDQTVEAIGDALAVYRRAIDEGVEAYLHGRPVQPVFSRFD